MGEYDQALPQGREAIRDEQGRTINEAVVRRARILLGHLRVWKPDHSSGGIRVSAIRASTTALIASWSAAPQFSA